MLAHRVFCMHLRVQAIRTRIGRTFKVMFSEPPIEWVKECQQAWFDSREKDKLTSLATNKERATKRACLFTEEELNPPYAQRNKPVPADGVSFF